MQTINLKVNGRTLTFTGNAVSYAGHELLYSKMSNIAHRGDEKPAFLFDYDGKRLALPYEPQDKEVITKIFQQIVAMNKKREEEAKEAESLDGLLAFADDEAPDQPVSTAKPTTTEPATAEPKVVYVEKKKDKGFWSVGRLVIGIVSMVLFIFITFQSCAAGLSNTLEENGELSGSAGFFTAVMFLIAGIVGVCTRNTKGMAGPIVTAVLYFIGALLTIGTGDTYGDLPVWGGLSAIFGVVFVFCAIKTKLTPNMSSNLD
jgi:hypothetical protein